MLDVTSTVRGTAWPGIPGPFVSQLLAMQAQFEASQWLPPAEILQRQSRQLGVLLAHAYETVPFYRRRFDQAGLHPSQVTGPEQWVQIPPLARSDIQTSQAELLSTAVPAEHGPQSKLFTSGSTGKPVMIVGTAVTQLFWNACTLRDHLWHRRSPQSSLAAIRSVADHAADPPEGAVAASWGPATDGIVRTGPAYTLSIHSTIDQQADWLQRCNPNYLLTYPSNVMALMQHAQQHGWRLPNLREVRTFGEIVEPHVRAACQRIWNVPLVDMYSSQEVGYIALECPDSDAYHVQSENVLVEVIDEAGQACQPGEIGRLLVTTLHNFAMPLIRYDIGDYAEVGGACECGRGLPVLRRIVGRQRNMLVLPNGDRRWPAVELAQSDDLQNFPPIEQFQLVQRSLTQLEMLLVARQRLCEREEQLLRGWIESAVRHPLEIAITYVDAIPRGPSGKFEDFRCEVSTDRENPTCRT